MNAAAVSGPARVTVVAVIVLVQGLLILAAGIGFVVARDNESLLAHVDESSTTIATYGWAAIAWGVIALLVARGLFRGANWSRVLVGLLQLINIVGGAYVLVRWGGQYRWQGIQQVAIGLVALWMLFSARADQFFRE